MILLYIHVHMIVKVELVFCCVLIKFCFSCTGDNKNITNAKCAKTVDGPVWYCDSTQRWDKNTSKCIGKNNHVCSCTYKQANTETYTMI